MFFSKSEANDTSKSNNPCNLTSAEIMEFLRPIDDPDLGMSIVDMGLIYTIENNEGDIYVEMTFTTPACPYGPQLLEEVKYTLRSIEGVKTADVEVVWDPPWSMDCITEAAKIELGMDI